MGTMWDTSLAEKEFNKLKIDIEIRLNIRIANMEVRSIPTYIEGNSLMFRIDQLKLAKNPRYNLEYPICAFRLSEYHGNCGILVSHNMYIYHEHRGKGLGQLLQPFKEKVAKLYNYTMMQATTLKTNDAENHILQKFDWQKLYEFTNRRTKNDIIIWQKELNYD